MAKITVEKNEEEYFAKFIRVSGNRGVVLIFDDDDPDDKSATELAEDIAKVIDG